MKKIVCIILAVAILLSMSAVVLAASADVVQTSYNTEETYPPEEFTEPYVAPPTLRFRELADGTMEVYMYDDEMWAYYYSLTAYYVGNLIIPLTYNGKPVTRISKLGGHGISIVDSITIPESITYIEEDAFSDFYGVKTIYYNAVNCKHMGNVSSDGNIRSIFNEDTSSIENIVIGEKVEVIPDYAFYGLTNLKEIAIPDTVTSIGQYSFKGNSQLESIHIPDNVRRIGDYAFADCSKLKTIIFDAVNCEIGTFTTDFNNVKVNPAFDGCTSLESIVFGENVEVIPNFAFYGAKNLKEITIPENIKSIGGQIFGTATIETLNYNSVDCTKAGISWNEYIDGGEGGWWESFTRTPFYGTKVQQLNINSTVNNLPNGLIGNMDIVSVNISAQLSSVGGFSNMQSLVEVSLPQSITEIKENAFANCPNLSIINIPYAVNKVGTRAFENTAWLNNQPKGCVYINNVLYKYKSTGQQDNVAIREGTTDILENAFSGADNVQSIILPNSLTSIGNNAFSDCSALKEISIPDSVISLGTSAFYNCSSLSSVILGNGINNIESNCFNGCVDLETIIIPDSVVSIGRQAFNNCTDLQTVTLGKGINEIGYKCFSGCRIAKVEIPNTQMWFDIKFSYYGTGYDWNMSTSCNPLQYGADLYVNGIPLSELVISNTDKIQPYLFYNCKSLKTVIINGNVSEIGDYAFFGCSNLQEVKLKKNVSKIGEKVFWNCAKLKDIYIYNSDCDIRNAYETISGSATIHSYDNSSAQMYAGNYNRNFALIENMPVILGDADGDGDLNITDATCIQRHLAEIPVYEYIEEASDTDGDGQVSIIDVTMIQRYLAQLPCPKGIGEVIK